LSIHDNQFTGKIPATIGNLKALEHLDLSSNQFSGDFPVEMGALFNLTYFFASANDWTQGLIPKFLENLDKLEELGLKSTRRFGNIPSFLGFLPNLQLLDLDNNALFGPLPPELGQLGKLEFLLLNRNQLSGFIPENYSALTSLRMAFFDKNALIGSMAPICRLPTFQNPQSDDLARDLLTADCDGVSGAEITCACCRICCDDLIEDCNNNYEIANQDPRWESR
jgi:Leucine-rich repeat (LRR) protein